ncbi:MAG TPA: 2-dehydropantoate 2-reductase [Pilimelia sp.]|nr:2-dehydropantoate 2-reductase [Pilimelia sp.]
MADVAVVGVGAIGGVLASELLAAGRHAVRLCVRIGFSGLVRDYAGRTYRHAVSPLTRPAPGPPVDWVLLATKAHQVDAAAGWLPALMGPHTRVAVVQNGVEHTDRLARHVRPAAVVPVVVNCPSTAVAPGHVEQYGPMLLTMPDDAGGQALHELCTGTAVRTAVVEDWLTVAWTKLCFNAVSGSLTTLTGRPHEVFRDDAIAELGRRLAREVVAVGRACGADLPDSLVEETLADLRSRRPESGNSILHDRRRGRPLEYDARNGVVSRKGAEHGIPTPYSDTIVALLGALSDPHRALSDPHRALSDPHRALAGPDGAR